AGFAERHQHCLVEVRDLRQLIADAELAALLAGRSFAPFERFGRAALQLRGNVFVEALDRCDLIGGDVGDLLEAGEALRDQQLRQRLIDVELALKQGGALDELALTLFARIGLGQDVDLAGGELARQSDVLAASADRQAELVVRDHHLDPRFFLVDNDAADGRGLERVDDEGRGVGTPGNDVDLLALELLDHGLDPAALHTDAGAHGIDRAVVTDHADLGAAARIPGGGLDLDDAVVNLGHFLREQLLHEFRVRTAEEDLRAASFAADGHDQRADAVADADHLARDLLVAANDALGPAKVDDHVAEL